MTDSRPHAIAPVRKVAIVPQAPEAAFRLFTDEMAAWWPLATHSVGLASATHVTVEHGVGGRIVESLASGETAIWGTVTVWQPPDRIGFTWHPGTPEAEATDVEVTFAQGPDGTVVELVHTGWERRPDGLDTREGYDSGWEHVLALYAGCAER